MQNEDQMYNVNLKIPVMICIMILTPNKKTKIPKIIEMKRTRI